MTHTSEFVVLLGCSAFFSAFLLAMLGVVLLWGVLLDVVLFVLWDVLLFVVSGAVRCEFWGVLLCVAVLVSCSLGRPG